MCLDVVRLVFNFLLAAVVVGAEEMELILRRGSVSCESCVNIAVVVSVLCELEEEACDDVMAVLEVDLL